MNKEASLAELIRNSYKKAMLANDIRNGMIFDYPEKDEFKELCEDCGKVVVAKMESIKDGE